MVDLKHITDTYDAKTAGESFLKNKDGPQHEPPIYYSSRSERFWRGNDQTRSAVENGTVSIMWKGDGGLCSEARTECSPRALAFTFCMVLCLAKGKVCMHQIAVKCDGGLEQASKRHPSPSNSSHQYILLAKVLQQCLTFFVKGEGGKVGRDSAQWFDRCYVSTEIAQRHGLASAWLAQPRRFHVID
jgi:hypothetical protein